MAAVINMKPKPAPIDAQQLKEQVKEQEELQNKPPDVYADTKAVLTSLQERPFIEKSYDILPGTSVTFRSMLAFEHRYFLSWIAKSMPEDIKLRTRNDFEMGMRNIANFLIKFGDESLSRLSPYEVFPTWTDRKLLNKSDQEIKDAIHDVYNNKLEALKTKSDVATSIISKKAKQFYDECVHVDYNPNDNKHFDEISLENIIFDSDKTIKANVHGIVSIEFGMLTNRVMSIVEQWVDQETYDSKAEMDYMRFIKYLAASTRSINGIRTSGNPLDYGFIMNEPQEEHEMLRLYEKRLNYLLSLPHSFVILLDSCRSHLANVLHSKISDMSGGLKN